MMVANSTTNELKTWLTRKQAALQDLTAKLEAVREDVRAIERVLGFYPNGTISMGNKDPMPRVTASELRGMETQKQALGYIADKCEGTINVNLAKQLLIDAGLVKGQHRLVYGHIYNMLKADDNYQHVGKGTGEFQRKQRTLPL